MATVKTSSEFEEYRRKMHPEEEADREVAPAPHRAIGLAFGIFMCIVYVGVGIMFLVNFFDWIPSFTWARYFLGVVLIAYGLFRVYREFKGSHYYGQ